MKNSERILALREGFCASWDEYTRLIAEDWDIAVDSERSLGIISVKNAMGASVYGAGSYTKLRGYVELCLNNPDVKQIVLEINSPGGDVNGLFECCEYLSKATGVKPIHAHVTGLCCSAAFAIAASCTDISATETSEIGSVGIYSEAQNWEKFDEKQGLLTRIFRSKNAKNKNLSAFTEEGAQDRQEKMDFYEDCFYTVLSEGRGMDRDRCIESFGHGASFLAREALERNMVDSIVAYDELISKLSSPDDVEEDEGDDMDISKLTAEEKSAVFKALVEENPSLLAEAEGTARETERSRVMGLYALRTDDNKDIVDAAISGGKSAESIYGDLYRAEKERADKLAQASANLDTIRKQAENEQGLPDLKNPMPDDLGAQAKAIGKTVTDARKKGEEKK